MAVVKPDNAEHILNKLRIPYYSMVLALWHGRAVQPIPERRGTLFERSEFVRRRFRRTAQGTRRVMLRPTWLWVLLPKQKRLVRLGETRQCQKITKLLRIYTEEHTFTDKDF